MVAEERLVRYWVMSHVASVLRRMLEPHTWSWHAGLPTGLLSPAGRINNDRSLVPGQASHVLYQQVPGDHEYLSTSQHLDSIESLAPKTDGGYACPPT